MLLEENKIKKTLGQSMMNHASPKRLPCSQESCAI